MIVGLIRSDRYMAHSIQVGVPFSTLMRLEAGEGAPAAQAKTLDAIQKAFETVGIEFIGSPEDGTGVRWKSKK